METSVLFWDPQTPVPSLCLQASRPHPPSIPFAGDFRQSGSSPSVATSWSQSLLGETLVRETRQPAPTQNEVITSPPTPPPCSRLLRQPLSPSPGPFSDCPLPLEPCHQRLPCLLLSGRGRREAGQATATSGAPARPLGSHSRTLTTPPATAKLGHLHS